MDHLARRLAGGVVGIHFPARPVDADLAAGEAIEEVWAVLDPDGAFDAGLEEGGRLEGHACTGASGQKRRTQGPAQIGDAVKATLDLSASVANVLDARRQGEGVGRPQGKVGGDPARFGDEDGILIGISAMRPGIRLRAASLER